ncbi:MAG: hypothetical protein PHV33_00055 [Elusimicrobiales bacterium]|nr:hypothetical protein [Elusimicrobiales bacterium]
MPVRRRIKVRVRGKVRNQLLRRGGMAAGITLGLLLGSWLFGAAIKNYRRILADRLSFKPELFEVNCPSPEAAESLRALAADAAKRPFSSRRAGELAAEMRRLRPGLASVSISRNFFTGKASVKAVPERAVAAVLADGATAYLGVTGRLMPENLSGSSGLPFAVQLRGAPREAPGFSAFLAGLGPLVPLFYSAPRALSCEAASWDCRLRLADGSVVLWGEFEFTRLKILRLNEVMNDALQKSGGPLRADLRSFREGKIFVSALTQP